MIDHQFMIASSQRQMPTVLRYIAAMICCTLVASATTHAQPAASGAIRGIVVDDSGKPIEGAEVMLMQRRLRARTTSDGSFLFDRTENGKYTLEVRHIGYRPITGKTTVKDGPAEVRISMTRAPFSLPSVITVASRGGLSGVIADTGYRPLPGVKVSIQGARVLTETDSAGAFYAAVAPGRYLVVLRRSGFARQIISVNVPKDTGRQIAAWMVPEKKDSDPRQGAMLFDQLMRINAATAATSRFVTREDVERLGTTDLRQLGASASGQQVSPDCPVAENGDPKRTLPLWAIAPKDLEFLEVYWSNGGGTAARAQSKLANVGGLQGMTGNLSAAPAQPCAVRMVIWWRK